MIYNTVRTIKRVYDNILRHLVKNKIINTLITISNLCPF